MERSLKVRELPKTEQPRHRADYYGLEALSNSELLQLIASFTYLETATDLLKTAGGLTELARLTTADLCQVQDVGPAAATAIKAAIELGRRLSLERVQNSQITSPTDAANIFISKYGHKEQEHFAVMLLDNKNRIIGLETVYIGTVNSITVRSAEIYRLAVRHGAVSLILSHNHPSGDPSPSPEDVMTTRNLVAAGEMLGIQVLDHIVVGHNRYVSLKERGLGFDL